MRQRSICALASAVNEHIQCNLSLFLLRVSKAAEIND